ncbi:MAG: hypothetical protein HXS48_09980 [Theionarchaea archaeon]|nr:hypothetical protein [Theionarchaea archaeon]
MVCQTVWLTLSVTSEPLLFAQAFEIRVMYYGAAERSWTRHGDVMTIQ